MAQTNIGKVAMTPRGAYSESATYEALDIITHNGSSYIVLQSCTGITPPNDTYYQIIASKGATGASGSAGTIAAGTVTMGAYNTLPLVTNSGTSNNAVFDFVIPKQFPEPSSTGTYTLKASYLGAGRISYYWSKDSSGGGSILM